MFANKNYQDTEFKKKKKTIMNLIKEFKEFKGDKQSS